MILWKEICVRVSFAGENRHYIDNKLSIFLFFFLLVL